MTTPQSIEIMRMNNEYFDSLINRMIIGMPLIPLMCSIVDFSHPLARLAHLCLWCLAAAHQWPS